MDSKQDSNTYGFSDINYGAIPTLTSTDVDLTISPRGTGSINFSNTIIGSNTYTMSGVSITMPASSTSTSSVYTVPSYSGTSADAVWIGANSGGSSGGKIKLTGEDADIDINGMSLKTFMLDMQERLNMLVPNPELEQEWDELRKLGERYRKMEKRCKQKSEVWKKLKSMPPPEVK